MKYGKSLAQVSDGYLTIKHYKEPLKAIPRSEGFGYYGTIMGSLDGKYIQCHVCGNLYGAVHSHARMAHKLSDKEYRDRFLLSGSTALVSEHERQTRKERTLQWLKGMTKSQREAHIAKTRRNFVKWRRTVGVAELKEIMTHKHKLETKNKRGTCPDQLLQKILEVSKRVGHAPSLREFIIETGGTRYKHLVFATFGSWKKALSMLDMTTRQGGSKEKPRYTREGLLEQLVLFAQENRTIPTATDAKRGWIPDDQVYRRQK